VVQISSSLTTLISAWWKLEVCSTTVPLLSCRTSSTSPSSCTAAAEVPRAWASISSSCSSSQLPLLSATASSSCSTSSSLRLAGESQCTARLQSASWEPAERSRAPVTASSSSSSLARRGSLRGMWVRGPGPGLAMEASAAWLMSDTLGW